MDEQLTDSFGSQTKAQAEKTMRQNLTNAGRSFNDTGTIAVDTLSRPADQNVNREVDLINQAQNQQPSTALMGDINRAVSTIPPVERTRDDFRSDADAVLAEIQGTNIAESTAEVREREEVALKEERARTLSNNLIARDREIQRQREALENNPNKRSRMGLESEIAKFNRESARELADLSFSYQVALGDYQAAEKIASDYAQDLRQDLQNKQNTWQMLMKMSEMTDEEKMIANQNFAEKQMQDQFEISKKMAVFSQQLQQSDPMYQAELRKLQGGSGNILPSLLAGMMGGQVSDEELIRQEELARGMTLTPEARQDVLARGQRQPSFNEINQALSLGIANGEISATDAAFIRDAFASNQGVSPFAEMVMGNPSLMEGLTPTERGNVLKEIAGAGEGFQTAAQESSKKMTETALQSAEQLKDLTRYSIAGMEIPLINRLGFKGAVGIKGPTSFFGLKEKPIAGTPAANFNVVLETLKSQIHINNLEFMRGLGRMSQEQFLSLQKASEMLSTDLSERQFRKVLNSTIKTLEEINLQQGARVGQTSNQYQSPSGNTYNLPY